MARTEGVSEAEAFKAFEAAGWSKQAETYGALTGAITVRFAEPLLDAAGVRAGVRVLDLATGPGYALERARARGAIPTGIDIAEPMVAVARRRNPGIELIVADAEDLPFEAGSFDAVTGGFVLGHLPAPERAISEAARVLTPGGKAAFSAWDSLDRMRVNGVMVDAIDEAGAERPSQIATGPDPARLADEGELRDLLAAAGLRDVGVETISLTHRVPDAEAFWEGSMASTVRMRAIVTAQAAPVRARIREALERLLERYRTADGLEVPVSAKIAYGKRPAG